MCVQVFYLDQLLHFERDTMLLRLWEVRCVSFSSETKLDHQVRQQTIRDDSTANGSAAFFSISLINFTFPEPG